MASVAWPEDCGPLRLRPARPLLLAAVLFGLEALLPALPAVVPPTVAIAAAAFPGGVRSGVFEAVWAAALLGAQAQGNCHEGWRAKAGGYGAGECRCYWW